MSNASPAPFWWENFAIGRVAPHDYPPFRVKAARRRVAAHGPRLARMVDAIVVQSSTAEQTVRRIARVVQDALMHPPLLQPAEADFGYWWWRRCGLLPASWAARPRVEAWLHQRLVMEAELLLELGEGRCGHCAALLCAALRHAGFSAQPLQLPRHIAVEVVVDGEARIVDADAFKHGIMLERDGRLATRREVEANLHLVDRFKPTGWMFRRDSRYACNERTGRRYEGYLDFYTPEEDGQMSARYGASLVLKPPGVPRWLGGDATQPVTIERGRAVEVAFTSSHAERASGYRVRCGRRSRGYRYDALVPGLLAQETSNEVFEFDRAEPQVSVRFEERGRHYLAAAAIPVYSEEFPSYLWWSDELIFDVV